ncbi:MAG: hypothetical protein JWM68_307, partial [Verrucomicrobiales bacterium]|nr:hypothetical protein [Verrucomicrobiales bacterium]
MESAHQPNKMPLPDGVIQLSIEPPLTLNGRRLSADELAQWAIFNEAFPLYVVSDKVADSTTADLPPASNVAWCSLYSLALYFMSNVTEGNVPGKTVESPARVEWLEWQDLISEYWKYRDIRLQAF